MWPIFKRYFKDRRIILLIYCLAAAGLLWMYISLFPFVKSQAEALIKAMEAYPKSFMDAFGMGNPTIYLSTLEGYIASEMFSLFWPVLVVALLVSTAGNAISGEIEKGTIESLLSQPISRAKLFFARYLVGVSNLFLFATVSIFATVPLAAAYNITFKFESYLKLFLISFMFALAMLSIAFLLSAIFSERGRVYFISIAILILMYALNIIASLKESISDLKYLSFFHYYDASTILTGGNLELTPFLVFGGVSIICTLAGVIWFIKRDIAVS